MASSSLAYVMAALACSAVVGGCHSPVDSEHEPMRGRGGGPIEPGYSPAEALEVLRAARCERARICGLVGDTCEREAKAIYAPPLAQCEHGVDRARTDDCALHVRSSPCSSPVRVMEACRSRAVCREQ